MSAGTRMAVVIPTVGRSSVIDLLTDLHDQQGAGIEPEEVLVVDDRGEDSGDLDLGPGPHPRGLRVLAGGGRGPAAARNTGWRAASADWIVFLDDDVRLTERWSIDLATDLRTTDPQTAAICATVRVPKPPDRAPTDDELAVIGLETAGWITADAAVRRADLEAIGGFDERFPRAYREDTDLALRLLDADRVPVTGRRVIHHPLRDDPRWSSIRRQAGNIDDALMDRLHGPDWRDRVGADRGLLRRHVAVTATALLGLAAGLRGRRRVAAICAAVATASTIDFARRRLPGGHRSVGETASVAVTSIAIPPVAVASRAWGDLRARRIAPVPRRRLPRAVLLDRDGTLIDDVPYNGDPELVTPVPGARLALDRLRLAGIPLGIVSNQRGLALGRFGPEDLRAVNERVETLLGPFPVIACCPHDRTDGCACRKPAPGLIESAAEQLGVDTRDCVVIGDIGSDVDAAAAAGAVGILVPTALTRAEEIERAPTVARDLHEAVDLLLRGRP